jgi:arylformamidase
MKKIYDISLTLSEETVNWPSDPPFKKVHFKSLAAGGSSNVSAVSFGTHFGTHIDPPLHMMEGGAGVDRISLACLVGDALVIDAKDAAVIDAALLRPLDLTGVERVLFKTRNSDCWKRKETQYRRDFVGLTVDAAELLARKGMKFVGIDYLSIEAPGSTGHPVHKVLMRAGTVIAEGLDLSEVPAGTYLLVCAPLKLKDGDGGPSRVFLLQP